MSMTFDQMRTRFAAYMLTEAALDLPISTTDRDALLNEAYLEYESTYGSAVLPSATYASVAVSILVGASESTQWLQVDSAEVEDPIGSLIYVPLIRGTFGAMLRLHATLGETGTPRQYGISLNTRNLSTHKISLRFAPYPAPTGSRNYRFWIKRCAPDLVNGGDATVLDEPEVDYAIRIAAFRAGSTLGYPEDFLASLVAPIPDAKQAMMSIDHFNRSTAPIGKGHKAGEDERAA